MAQAFLRCHGTVIGKGNKKMIELIEVEDGTGMVTVFSEIGFKSIKCRAGAVYSCDVNRSPDGSIEGTNQRPVFVGHIEDQVLRAQYEEQSHANSLMVTATNQATKDSSESALPDMMRDIKRVYRSLNRQQQAAFELRLLHQLRK